MKIFTGRISQSRCKDPKVRALAMFKDSEETRVAGRE